MRHEGIVIARRWLLLLMFAFLVGCTSAREGDSIPRVNTDVTNGTTVSPPPPTYAPVPAICPKDFARRVRRHAVVGEAHSIVPGTPVALVLCGPGARVEIATALEVSRFADALNKLKRVPAGEVFSCPLDFGPTYGLYFNYENGDVLLVTVDASGCRMASNGRSSGWVSHAMLNSIKRVLRGD